jgi:glycosyl-4,4'-diaponeurosporenoate acyltransferase
MSAPPVIAVAPIVALVLNIALWATSQIASGYAAHRLPLDRLQEDRWLLRLRRFETDGRWYERRLRISRWKDRLPEAGAFFDGGMTKRTLPGRSDADLERFAAETRRAEIAHWASFTCLPFCVLWNDGLGIALMCLYGLVVNLPLIAIQRSNRSRIDRILAARTARRPGADPRHGRRPHRRARVRRVQHR